MSSNKPKSRLKLTNLGKWLVFLALFLLFSAQNTGNNLLYLICSCIITALFFALTNMLFSGRSINAEIIYPKIVNVGQSFDIVCKLQKNDILARYYMRFEDSWIELLKRGENGYFRKTLSLDERGKYIFKNFSLIKPSMLDVFYYQYTFPDFVIYAEDRADEYNQSNSLIKSDNQKLIKKLGRDGDFYSLEAYQDGEDASLINWVISARSTEEWVVIREKEDEKAAAPNHKALTEKQSAPDLNSLESFIINGKSYSNLFSEGLSKSLNPFVYRIMILLALLTCFGVYSIGFLQGLATVLSVFFIFLGIKGKAISKEYHKYVYILCAGIGLYILLKTFAPNSPARIVLLLEFSVLILSLQFLTMLNIRSLLGALTLIFMIVLGIAAMNINSAYPAIFLPFLIITSMILTFFRVNLVCPDMTIKNRYAINPRGVIGTISLLFIFSLLWIPFFYLIPRTNSYGIASELAERRNKGFNNNSMSLNESGFLEDNLTVVMRIIPNEEKTMSPSIIRRLSKKLIRGGSFSEYENGEWRKRRRGSFVRDLRSSSGEYVLDRDFKDFKLLHNFDVVLENSETASVFYPYGTKVIDYRNNFIGVEADGSMFFVDRRANNTKRYSVSILADDPEIEDSNEEDLGEYESDFRVSPYFSLNGTTDKMQYLSNVFAAKTQSIKGRVGLVMDYLQKNCNYSLEQPELVPGEEPVEKFLFEKMAGTCQHYSTTMVLLLRCMGIPSRVVNGYMMNEWNETGGFFTVRQSHAHAWVEVFFPKSGWVPFDPTPNDSGAEPSRIRRIWDKIIEIYEGYWFNYVYSFDHNAQTLAKRTYFSNIYKNLIQVINSPYFLIGLFLIIIGFMLFYRYIRALYCYYTIKPRWLPLSYYIWESKSNYIRKINETPFDYHNRLFANNIIDEKARDVLIKVEELIDELAFKPGSDKKGISSTINQLLKEVKI